MSYVREALSVGDLTVKIVADEYPCNPRKDYDNVGTMVCWHRRYNLGDDHNFKSPDDFFKAVAGEDAVSALDAWYEEEYERRLGDYDQVMREMGAEYRGRLREAAEQDHVILPLYLYDHSGITISTSPFSCQWDSGQIGYIYCSIDKAREEWSVGDATDAEVREKATKYLEGEVETYDQYLTGDVWGYVVEDEEGEQLESCWSFFGDHEYCASEGRKAAEYHWKKIKSRRDEVMAAVIMAERPDMYGYLEGAP